MFKIIVVVALCAAVYCAPAAPAQGESNVNELQAPEDKELDSSIPSVPADNKEALEGAESVFIRFGAYPIIRSYPYYYPGPIVYNARRHVYLYK